MEQNLAGIGSTFPVFYLNTIKIKDIYNLIFINKKYKEIICESYNGLFPSNLELLFFEKDPWYRNMSDQLGILGMKALPVTIDFNMPRFCIKNGLNQELFNECKSSSNPMFCDIYILLDNSRSTDFVFCVFKFLLQNYHFTF